MDVKQPLTLTEIKDRNPHTSITGIHFHSAKIKPGNIFIAIEGFETDGHQYIEQAIKAGASIVIGEKDIVLTAVPYYKVENARLALANLTREFYKNPSEKHIVIGITGTNGKTTISYMLHHILDYAGKHCSLFGSIKNIVNGREITAKKTTPDALEIQQRLDESEDPYVIMEVSSQGLDQHRVSGVAFDYAIFTNLTREHLEYHHTMEKYFQVKAKLFDLLKHDGVAVINSHSQWSHRLEKRVVQANKTCIRYGSHHDDQITWITTNGNIYNIQDGNAVRKLSLIPRGTHNIYNALAAILTAKQIGIASKDIFEALETFPGVPGRFEVLSDPTGRNIVIDYAHTPDGLHNCLKTAKQSGARKLIHIFGFRGKRDGSKWKEMLQISSRHSQEIILTFDDLNGISPEQMLEDYRRLSQTVKNQCTIISDRPRAIESAWKRACAGDWIVITGKGHESYRESYSLPTRSDKETVQYVAENLLRR